MPRSTGSNPVVTAKTSEIRLQRLFSDFSFVLPRLERFPNYLKRINEPLGPASEIR
jgi:hypothetical protein